MPFSILILKTSRKTRRGNIQAFHAVQVAVVVYGPMVSLARRMQKSHLKGGFNHFGVGKFLLSLEISLFEISRFS
jgi:hypothetical protein